jgi:hypothetical protein
MECNENSEPLSFPRSLAATTSRFLSGGSSFHRLDIITISFLIWFFRLRIITISCLSLDCRIGLCFSPEHLVKENRNESNGPSTTQGRGSRRTGVDRCLFTILQLKGASLVIHHVALSKEHTMKTSPLLSTIMSMDLPPTTFPSSSRREGPLKFTLT